jgi:hypothetical protein
MFRSLSRTYRHNRQCSYRAHDWSGLHFEEGDDGPLAQYGSQSYCVDIVKLMLGNRFVLTKKAELRTEMVLE